ncbi:hypothetical protein METBIDRAFT_40311 [Metschnikowia bicuspidata var. bicuspidata NRRL YB-4993]|uniref:Zn(2)-C6 fungal-type domain-containing protein n=1 Tax=Metschnikowia bicuspidata var. bicuspidata NRRL YB-4993 TaxID=869754 RepID=A0A1A0HDI8_9ASCO|nr:hypothetical protein METBIDRAFT_40311 [Metschnikowia bicuspidata var. bicuspidata NRRL YB-4993]OBA22040.1 hypothetical protein METBIDRAFT_40311 [Metschnikowia bicuspidata var. bicuspidata NRRL YB-4993]
MEVAASDASGASLISPYSGTAFDATLSRPTLSSQTGEPGHSQPDTAAATAAAMTVLADGNVIKHQRSRQRKVHSCVACHKKKIKCSRDHPVCASCLRSDSECRYFVNKRVSRGGRTPTARRTLGLGSDRTTQPGLDQALAQTAATDPSPPHTRALSLDAQAHAANDTATHNCGSLAPRKQSAVDPHAQPPAPSVSEASANIAGHILRPVPQKVTSPSTAFANFVDGPTSSNVLTTNMSTSLTASKQHLAPLGSAQENSLNPYSSNPATTVNYLYGTNVNYHNGDIFLSLISHLPKRERSFELVQRYLYSVHDLLPILVNMDEFVREHERFWARMDPDGSSPASSQDDTENFEFLQFYTLYFPVMYASTISEFEEYDNLLLNQDIDRYLKAFNKICQHYNYPHGLKSTPLLLGNVIIQSTSPNPSTMEMSQIIRYAKFLHLHKDPVKTLRIQDWKVVGFRRKLWWVIFGLDALSSHNFCLPPVCRFSDFNVEIPDHYDPIFSENGSLAGKKLNVSTLAMCVKFRFDRILSDLVYQLHNGLASNISSQEIDTIRDQISSLFVFIHQAVLEINTHFKKNPPKSVAEMNMFNFVKHHSWSFADRALMLLHKKILLTDRHSDSVENGSLQVASWTLRSGPLSLNQYEDTFGRIQESNIIKNFQDSSIGLLRFSQNELFSYNDLLTNLIPSILHNLNDFLKYNDFIKFGKFNWYVKRTIPLDSIILLLAIMSVKLKYEYMGNTELVVFVKLVNKTLFILNRKYFKNEKYKRMLSLTNATWEYILKKYNVVKRITPPNGNASGCAIEFLDHQVAGILNTSELFTIMDVPQPAMVVNGQTLMPPHAEDESSFNRETSFQNERNAFDYGSAVGMSPNHVTDEISGQVGNRINKEENNNMKTELIHLNNKIYYDLRNNFVDINDYCTFYSSLENVLHSLMDYINDK